MTEQPTGGGPPEPQAKTPWSPKPTNLFAALILAAVIIWNITLDAHSDTYDGSYVTYGLVIGLCGVLGFDLSRFWPGGRDK